jgi:pyrimidine deaminase RibD-like protein
MGEDKSSDRRFMEEAIVEARKSKSQKYDPKVGAVICRDDHQLASGYRGERGDGMHAEASALEKMGDSRLAVGATIFTTLEPCTVRTRQRIPCADLLVKRRVRRVVIGMLDPNHDIRGEGQWQLEDARIEIGYFDSDLVQTIKAMNFDFIDYERDGLGIQITQPVAGESVSSDRPISLRGSYRMHPRPGDRIVVFHREERFYYPQAPISWNRKDRSWEGSAWLASKMDGSEHELIVARISADFEVAQRLYSRAHAETGQWIGIELQSQPPGFEVLASVPVKFQK